MDRPGDRQGPEGSGEQIKMEETGYEVTRGAPTTPSVKGQMENDQEEDKADLERVGKTSSGNGQTWSSPRPRGQWRTGKDGGN